jgi:hypothetical protein
VPDVGAVMKFTAELDLKRLSQSTRGRSFASRIFPFLQRFQSFSSIVSTFVSSNPEVAALVWGSVQLTMQVSGAALLWPTEFASTDSVVIVGHEFYILLRTYNQVICKVRYILTTL